MASIRKVKTICPKLIALFLLLLAGCPYINYFIQEAAQKAVRHEMEERLEQQMLHSIRIKHSEIIWAEKGKEAWIHGRLFDIKSSKLSGEYIVLTGLYDDEETLIVKNLMDQQKNRLSGNRVTTGYFQLFGFAEPDNNELIYAGIPDAIVFPIIKMQVLSTDLSVTTPPPRFS